MIRKNRNSCHAWWMAVVLGTLVAPAGAAPIALDMFVAHSIDSGDYVISHIGADGSLLNRFGTTSNNEFRSHLAISGGHIYRSNPGNTSSSNIERYDFAGNLVDTINPQAGTTRSFRPIVRDYADASIYYTDTYGGTNIVRHLDDNATGANSTLALVGYSAGGGVADLDFGGISGSEALYGLHTTHPDYGPYRVSKIDAAGNVTLFPESSDLYVPYVTDLGSIAINPVTGQIHVATAYDVVTFDATGTQIDLFDALVSKPSLDVSLDGFLYLGNYANDQVSIYSTDGLLQDTISIPDAVRIVDIVVLESSTFSSSSAPVPGAISLLGLGLLLTVRKWREGMGQLPAMPA